MTFGRRRRPGAQISHKNNSSNGELHHLISSLYKQVNVNNDTRGLEFKLKCGVNPIS